MNTTTISIPPPTPAPTNRNPDCCDCLLPPDAAMSSDVTAVKEREYAKKVRFINRILMANKY